MKRILCVLTAALLSVPATHADVLDQSQTTTESDTCRLQVTTFMCSGPNAMTVAGSFKRAEDSYATGYELNLTGTGKGSGTFKLEIPRKAYTFTHDRIVEVNCP